MKLGSGIALTIALGVTAWAATSTIDPDPHGNPDSGVLRVITSPSSRGECQQCHPQHASDPDMFGPFSPVLFAENTNAVAFSSQGAAPCHGSLPTNYPLGESDRIPDTEPDAGYFEANTGGIRRVGVELRGRWPGEAVYTNAAVTPVGRLASPHAFDSDMPRRDAAGEGLCHNCHDPHGTPEQRDLLVERYGGIGGSASIGAPENYRLCFSCHGDDGAGGMDPENRLIEDFYDAGLNDKSAGHQIRRNSHIAISWPANVRSGDMLPCYDCHNPHGSRGNNGVEPNGFLISDQRPGWSGLDETLEDAEQARRFCFGCHIPSDGIPGSQTVEGIVMNTLPDEEEHASTATTSCYDCHGRDYTSPTGHNVHNPSEGDG